MEEGEEKEVSVVFKVLLVLSFITDTVLTLHIACLDPHIYTHTHNKALTHTLTETCMRV